MPARPPRRPGVRRLRKSPGREGPRMTLEARRARMRESLLGRASLTVLSWLYGAGVALRNGAYSAGLRRARHAGCRTVCIGNITTGGTGKTPAVLLAAQTLKKKGFKPAILSRGYGRKAGGRDVQALRDGRSPSWEEVGDEPWMMHRALKGLDIPILVSPDRVAAAETAVRFCGPDILLLDDGFGHRRLGRDADIVLLNALDPFGGGRLLPAGNLREPKSALARAALALVTHADQVQPERLAEIRAAIEAARPGLPVAESVHKAEGVYGLKDEVRHSLRWLKGRKVCALSAIGSPTSFEAELRKAGAEVVQAWRYPDHHPYTADEMRSIESVRAGLPLVTTFKDFPRLPKGWEALLSGEVLALGIRLEVVRGKAKWEEALCGEAVPVHEEPPEEEET
ncbi:tetraacyldisaccharide 4'-kinase [bacterium]|nr:MAG: tetraacyldisaccharide 4'-kinase [bacterium]